MSTLLFIRTEYNDFLSYSFSVHLCEGELIQNETKAEENMKKFLQKTSHEIISYFIGFSIHKCICLRMFIDIIVLVTSVLYVMFFISFFTCICHTRLQRILYSNFVL